MARKQRILQKRFSRAGLLIFSFFLIFSLGCGEEKPEASVEKQLQIGLMITPQGLNDKGFNDYAFDGLKEAEKKYNIAGTIIEPSTMKDPEASLRFFAGQKFDAIIVVGLAFNRAIKQIASESPDLKFYIIDTDIDEGNIKGISFREDEGSYLCGYLAAKMSKTGKVGFIGGVKIPVIERFSVGFRNGVFDAASATEIVEQYVSEDFSGFNNAKKASEMALNMYRNGCDVIFPAAGGSGLGVISAAVKTKKFVIGVDMNQDSLAPGIVLTSMLKRVDHVVEDIVKNLHQGKGPESIKRSYGLADGALNLTDFQLSFKVVGEELINELNLVKKQIIDGKVKTSQR